MIKINPEIILQSRHQVLYGTRGKERETFLRQLAKEHPIMANNDSFSVIYLDKVNFLPMEKLNSNINTSQLSLSVQQYFESSLLYNIFHVMNQQVDQGLFQEKFDSIFHIFIYLAKRSGILVKDMNDVVDFLSSTRQGWEEVGKQILETGSYFSEKVPAFIDIHLLENFQMMNPLNSRKPFIVIADIQEDIPLVSQQAINGVLGSRCNQSLSLKLAIEPDQWKTCYDSAGNLVQSVHDYGVEELDDSYKKYMKK